MTNLPRPGPVILGAGLAGLSCAYRLATRGVKVTVLEKEPHIGGLAASRVIDGLPCDYGPHRFHSRKKNIVDFVTGLMGENIINPQRKSIICMDHKYFTYPLDANNILANMSKRTLLMCFFDYALAKARNFFKRQADDTFESWAVNRFGRTLYRIFFGTYTQKVLGMPPSRISSDWAKERITSLDLWNTVKQAVFPSKNPPRTCANHFYYPREGGIGQIAEALKRKIVESGSQVLLSVKLEKMNCTAESPDKKNIGSVVFEHEGERREVNVSQLMSTIPITDLPSLLDPRWALENKSQVEKLKFRSLVFAYFILDLRSFSDNQWIYLPEDRFFSNRISEPKNFSSHNLSRDKTVLCAEISCDFQDEKWNMDPQEIRKNAFNDIRQLGIRQIGEKNVLGYSLHKVKHCYPLYDVDYKKNARRPNDFFSSFQNLDCFGRNALFKYGNMDDAIEMGLQAADTYLHKTQKVPNGSL